MAYQMRAAPVDAGAVPFISVRAGYLSACGGISDFATYTGIRSEPVKRGL